MTRPWDPNGPDQPAEDQRVARENRLAHDGAAEGYVGTGVGGAGVNSIVEQRILRERGLPVTANFGDGAYGGIETAAGTVALMPAALAAHVSYRTTVQRFCSWPTARLFGEHVGAKWGSWGTYELA